MDGLRKITVGDQVIPPGDGGALTAGLSRSLPLGEPSARHAGDVQGGAEAEGVRDDMNQVHTWDGGTYGTSVPINGV